MDIVQLIDFFVHLDKYLNVIIQSYGVWTYLILFLIIFCETGLVVTPFLPGDSLLFAAGAFAAIGSLKVSYLFQFLSVAAVTGNMVNYQAGYFMGPKVLRRENARFLRKEYLERTHRYYKRYGGMTIIIARFMPIIRTFAPFLAGVGRMSYGRFTAFNITGSIAWISTFIFGGYYFGNIPLVKRNFTLVIFTIILISLLPGIIGFLRQHLIASRNIK
jgi:membrane-associated protein